MKAIFRAIVFAAMLIGLITCPSSTKTVSSFTQSDQKKVGKQQTELSSSNSITRDIEAVEDDYKQVLPSEPDIRQTGLVTAIFIIVYRLVTIIYYLVTGVPAGIIYDIALWFRVGKHVSRKKRKTRKNRTR